MLIIYSPLLLITAWNETRQARSIKLNRQRGETDEDTTEEWEQLDQQAYESDEWRKKCEEAKPNLENGTATTEDVRALRNELRNMREELRLGNMR